MIIDNAKFIRFNKSLVAYRDDRKKRGQVDYRHIPNAVLARPAPFELKNIL